MVNATEYLDQNYPKGNRSQIIELDISHKSLEDKFNSTDFLGLRIINCSFNQLTGYFWGWRSTVEIFDCSYNLFPGTWLFVTPFLQKLNLSHNKMDGIKVTQNAITHFDVSDNAIFELDLSESGNLQILNCSYNPLTKLILPDSFDPISFDCSNTLLKKVETNSFIFDCQTGTKIIRNTASSLSSSFNSLNNSTIVGIIFGILGFIGLCVGLFLVRKKIYCAKEQSYLAY
ncbi:16328_t:CDS:1 [Dentiscutata erythropus]|uniref:16328_t:CDS:1 n=1 Tax=Dentiscutata erythropus TaxID=1348616 RepID=A0A9N9CCP1_9GLOM|nr:16328_t:CDS:1 [Dentiscutata erythropus]